MQRIDQSLCSTLTKKSPVTTHFRASKLPLSHTAGYVSVIIRKVSLSASAEEKKAPETAPPSIRSDTFHVVIIPVDLAAPLTHFRTHNRAVLAGKREKFSRVEYRFCLERARESLVRTS